MSDFNIVEAEFTHAGPTVQAGFFDPINRENSPILKGIGHVNDWARDPRFSKKMLPGATPEDMHEAHRQMRDEHLAQAKDLHTSALGASTRRERNEMRRNIVKHNKMAKKHQDMMNHFDPSNKSQIARPGPNYRHQITMPSSRQQNDAPPPREQNNAPPSQNGNAAPPPRQQDNASPPPIANSHRAPMYKPSDNAPPQHVIAPHHAKLWHSFLPKIKHWFTNKRPNSPISRSHLTGTPPMPMAPKQLTRSHSDQAAWHYQQAKHLKARLPHVSSINNRATTIQQANMHNKLAVNQATLASKAKAQVPQAPVKPPKLHNLNPEAIKPSKTRIPKNPAKVTSRPATINPVTMNEMPKPLPTLNKINPKTNAPPVAPVKKVAVKAPMDKRKTADSALKKAVKGIKKATKPIKTGQKMLDPAKV